MLSERIPWAQEPSYEQESGPCIRILRMSTALAPYVTKRRLFSSDFLTVTESTYSRSPPIGIP